MKKYKRYIFVILTVFFICCCSIILRGYYKTASENLVKDYLQSLSNEGLEKVVIFEALKRLEIYDQKTQQRILRNLAKIEPSLGADMQVPGAVTVWIELYYLNGDYVEITLPTFEYTSKFGTQQFFCTVDTGSYLPAFPSPIEIPYSIFSLPFFKYPLFPEKID